MEQNKPRDGSQQMVKPFTAVIIVVKSVSITKSYIYLCRLKLKSTLIYLF